MLISDLHAILNSTMTEDKYPMRINKYLAHQKLTTRREADTLIAKGLVLVNKKRAVLGQMVDQKDKVEIKGQKNKHYIYLAYFKPRGILTDQSNSEDKTILDTLPQKNIFPIGRLDKDSEGLIILTNDGRITDPLLNPDKTHDKEYLVTTNEKTKPSLKTKLEKGVDIEGYLTRPCQVKIVDENNFKLIITEGKKHQIRRMAGALGYTIKRLKRVRILNIKIKDLKPGEYRKIEGPELDKFLSSLEVNQK